MTQLEKNFDGRWRSRVWKWLGYGALVVALVGVGGAWWVWGWRVGALSFHESWTPEQRAALQYEADYLAHFVQHAEEDSALCIEPWNMWKRLKASIEARQALAGTMSELRRTAADGRSPRHDPQNVPMVALAIRLRQLPLAHALLERGESPHEVVRSELPGHGAYEESSFQTALSCAPFFLPRKNHPLPAAEHRELLEHMLAKGANPIPSTESERHTTFACLTVGGLTGEGATALEWLLDHGLELHTQKDIRDAVGGVLCHPGTLEVMRRVVPRYGLDQNAEARFLLLRDAVKGHADSLPKLRWLLKHFYDDASATPTAAAQELNSARDIQYFPDSEPTNTPSPMDLFCVTLSGMELPIDPATDATPDQVLEMLDLLLAHGGVIPEPEKYMPTDEALRQRFIEILTNTHPSWKYE